MGRYNMGKKGSAQHNIELRGKWKIFTSETGIAQKSPNSETDKYMLHCRQNFNIKLKISLLPFREIKVHEVKELENFEDATQSINGPSF